MTVSKGDCLQLELNASNVIAVTKSQGDTQGHYNNNKAKI